MQRLLLYNTLSRSKEEFKPMNPPFVGMYVCGPTVYSDVHLGNCRTFLNFDLIYRYLLHLGYKVRYVRNITDAGHLEGDQDEGDDKFAKKAKLEQLEPMEVVQKYTVGFHDVMQMLNNLPPSVEPAATGHIIEQQEMISEILKKGLAYEVNGTVYFDVEKYSKENNYGELTNRKTEELLEGTRELTGQDEKKGRLDFALWIKAKPETLMQWPSPWGKGFPGWHIECSAMSKKYLGEQFDIHGGGMDLQATHHTNEIAQSKACFSNRPVNYWLHTNMLTVNGVRMSKSAGNGFLPGELFAGEHPLLAQAYDPMTVRFFMLQSHYRSTLDFSNEALQASEKGLARIMEAHDTLQQLQPSANSSESIGELREKCYTAMNDDFNSPVLIAHLFELVRIINSANDKKVELNAADLEAVKKIYDDFVFDILGLKRTAGNKKLEKVLGKVVEMVLELRTKAKNDRNFALSDELRKKLTDAGVMVKDTKEGVSWKV
jgi:cysteinyl-tRNA synthetase